MMLALLDEEPNPNSVAIMQDIDRMRPAMRALVREYGYKIVRDMIDDGYHDAEELGELLRVWRSRKQAEWLATDYIKPAASRIIASFC